MKIVVISDTHGLHGSLNNPGGDLLVHAGDHLTHQGTMDGIREFYTFLGSPLHSRKIVIAGNHVFCFESDRKAREEIQINRIYLHNIPKKNANARLVSVLYN